MVYYTSDCPSMLKSGNLFFILFAVIYALTVQAKQGERQSATESLKEPDLELELVEWNTGLISPLNALGKLLILTKDQQTALFLPHSDNPVPFAQQIRQKLLTNSAPPSYLGFWTIEKDLYAFNAFLLSVQRLDPVTLTVVEERALVWDQINPPEDRGGKAPTTETNMQRAKFNKEWQSIPTQQIVGVTYGGTSLTHHQLWLLSALPSFPLLRATCLSKDPMQCKIQSFCNTNIRAQFGRANLNGLARKNQHELVLANLGSQTLHILDTRSCWHAELQKTLIPPTKLGVFSHFATDNDGNLWLNYGTPHPATNKSVYRWKANSW